MRDLFHLIFRTTKRTTTITRMATKTDKTPITMNNFRLPHLRLSDFIFGTLRDKVPEKKNVQHRPVRVTKNKSSFARWNRGVAVKKIVKGWVFNCGVV